MEWIDRLNRAVEYLEGHLERPDLGEAAKTPGAALKSYPPLRFAITVQGVEEMEYLDPGCTQFEVWIPVVKAKG